MDANHSYALIVHHVGIWYFSVLYLQKPVLLAADGVRAPGGVPHCRRIGIFVSQIVKGVRWSHGVRKRGSSYLT